MPKIIHGGKNSAPGAQNGSAVIGKIGWRSAVDRLKCCEEWWTTCAAQKTRTSCPTRWYQ